MKKKTILAALLSAVIASSAVSFAVSAAENTDSLIYGTMDIPYSEFFAGEGIEGVDAVSSATTGKWKNTNLVNGTYSAENEDGTGTILGVRYYVALTEETLAALGENNYNFTKTDETPAAYKNVTIEDGQAVFSAVVGKEEEFQAETSISTEMVWGDYVIDIKSINNNQGTSDIGTIYGAVLKTTDGSKYAMRHLQNIWRDELAWSTGFKTTEPHGNTLDFEPYQDMMGKTINEIVYITDQGIYKIAADLYVAKKFNGSVTVENADISNGQTTFTTEGFPEDYTKVFSVNNEGFTATDGIITYSNVQPGQYTLNIKDANQIYADSNTSFVLSTNAQPVIVEGNKLVKAAGASDEEFANFMKNITSVKVDEASYAASGKRSVKIIDSDGSINLEAASGDTAIFPEDKEYQLTVTATGYNTALEFTITKGETNTEESQVSQEESQTSVEESQTSQEESQTSAEESQNSEASETSEENSDTSTESKEESSKNENSQQSETTVVPVNNNTNSNNNTGSNHTTVQNNSSAQNNNSAGNTDAPKTGSSDTAIALLAALTASTAAILALKKKKANH